MKPIPQAQEENQNAGATVGSRWKATLLALVVTIMVGLCLTVMNTRGIARQDSAELLFDPSGLATGFSWEYEHGWPTTWMRSKPRPVPDVTPAVSKIQQRMRSLMLHRSRTPNLREEGSAWPPYVDTIEMHWMPLVCNVFVALAILSVVFFFLRYRFRKRNPYLFSLLDLAVLILLASLAFANFQHHRSISLREQNVIGESDGGVVMQGKRWHGPSWLGALLGQPQWLKEYWHVDSLRVDKDRSPFEEVPFAYFKYVREIEILGDPVKAEIEALVDCPYVERIEVELPFLAPNFLEPKTGESHASRIQKANVLLPSVTELKIDSSLSSIQHWPRAIDLVNCCPNLKQVSLRGKQYLVDDLMDLPAGIEEVEFWNHATGPEMARLQEQFPDANVRFGLLGGPKIDLRAMPWRSAEIQVNRRRKNGWSGSLFSIGALDLSMTEVDRDFLAKLQPVFADTKSIILGSLDTPETGIWLALQCPKLRSLNARTVTLEYEQLSKLSPLAFLFVEKGSITSGQFASLVRELELSILTIHSSDFSVDEMETIRAAKPDCVVKFK